MIIVAQRVGTIMQGRPDHRHGRRPDRRQRDARELLETNETYREIVYSQLSEAEAVGMSGRPAAADRPAPRPAAPRPAVPTRRRRAGGPAAGPGGRPGGGPARPG